MKHERASQWKLERYVLGELPSREMAALQKRESEDPEFHQAAQYLRESAQEILEQYPAAAIVPEIVGKIEPGTRRQADLARSRRLNLKRLLIASPILASFLAVLLIVFHESPGTRVKGGEAVDNSRARIVIFRKKDSKIELLKHDDRVRSGDLIQIAYKAAGNKFGVIVSRDGRGGVNLHFPENSEASTRLKDQSSVLLPSAYELDNAPRYECFYFITAMEEIDIREALARVKAAGRLPDYPARAVLDLPAAWEQFHILFNKEKSNE
jgi:hypothetical protein